MTSTKSQQASRQKKQSSNQKPSNQPTQKEKDLLLFRKAFLATVELIGLHAWSFDFSLKKLPRSSAQVVKWSGIRFAKVHLARDHPMDQYETIAAAVHEAIHVLIADLAEMAMDTFSEDQVTKQEEIIVNSLEKALTPVVANKIQHEK